MNKDIQDIQMTQRQNPNIKLEVDDTVLNSLKNYRINKIKKEITIQNSISQKVAEIRQSNNQITTDLLKKSIPDLDSKIQNIHNSNVNLFNLADRLSKDYFNINPPFLFHT